MRNFLRRLALTYGAVIGILILWSWCAVLASLHEARELPTAPELILYVVSLPTSHAGASLFEWADSFVRWRFGDTVALSAFGAFQVAVLYLFAMLVPKARRATKHSSTER